MVVKAEWIRDRLDDPKTLLIDARPTDEYTGADGGMGGMAHPGHIPGAFNLRGKQEFDGEIENDAFLGRPAIDVTRLVEEDGVVVAEGRVRAARRDGGVLNAVFCDVFVMRDAKIRHLTSYLMELPGSR